jgi:hypothetical protein
LVDDASGRFAGVAPYRAMGALTAPAPDGGQGPRAVRHAWKNPRCFRRLWNQPGPAWSGGSRDLPPLSRVAGAAGPARRRCGVLTQTQGGLDQHRPKRSRK